MFNLQNSTLILEKLDIMQNISLQINVNGKTYCFEHEMNGNCLKYNSLCGEHKFEGNITFEERGNSVVLSISAELEERMMLPIQTFDADNAIEIKFKIDLSEGAVARYMQNLYCSHVEFGKAPHDTQGLLVKKQDKHLFYLPIVNLLTKAQLEGDGDELTLYVSSECDGYNKINGDILVISCGDTPYESIHNGYLAGAKSEYFITPLKDDKKYPEFLNYFGWCTWNAFYHDVTAEKIIEKLKEFKEKNVPIKWILIDDGWINSENWRLKTLQADEEKFPNGLSKFIKTAKEEYGVEYVGVWHALSAYWMGIEKDSLAAKESMNTTRTTKSGFVVPDYEDEDKAFEFFNNWHKYLKNEGVDFLKVDCQGNIMQMCRNNTSVVKAARCVQKGLERSARENFDDALINCMGMGMENVQSRSFSVVMRNSDDFFPTVENGFKNHIIQNIYNSMFLNDLYYLDFDMWWTKHGSNIQSAVLRAISGGPVYVSDKIGETNGEVLSPLLDNNGKIIRCDETVVPTPDCVYQIPKNGVIKLMNSIGDASVLAVFNLNVDADSEKAIVKIDDIKLKNADEYVAYLYFGKKFRKFTKDTKIELELGKNGVEIINFYPVVDGKIKLGDTSKYINAGTIKM